MLSVYGGKSGIIPWQIFAKGELHYIMFVTNFQSIMRNLVRRYVTVQQRKAESQGVTEDDVNEIKQDISAFRCELVEILKNSGMNTSTASGAGSGELHFPCFTFMLI